VRTPDPRRVSPATTPDRLPGPAGKKVTLPDYESDFCFSQFKRINCVLYTYLKSAIQVNDRVIRRQIRKMVRVWRVKMARTVRSAVAVTSSVVRSEQCALKNSKKLTNGKRRIDGQRWQR
jgi:hypothetical protein